MTGNFSLPADSLRADGNEHVVGGNAAQLHNDGLEERLLLADRSVVHFSRCVGGGAEVVSEEQSGSEDHVQRRSASLEWRHPIVSGH